MLATTAPALQAGLWNKVQGLFSQEEAEKETVKVLIAEEKEGVMLQITGGYNIYDPYDERRLATRFTGKTAFIQSIQLGIKWGELFPKTYQVKFVPDHDKSTILVDGVQYEGTVTVYAVGGKLNIVNELPVESYLSSRLAGQFPEPMEREALNAVTIVARTDAYYHSKHGKNKFWDVRALDVGYEGYTYSGNTPHIAEAIDATRGMMMAAPGGDTPFAAEWTEHSAGQTIPYHVMYRRDAAAPVVGVHSEIAAQDRTATEWSYTVKKEALAQLAGIQHLSDITLHADDDSGKIFAVHLSDGTYSKDVDFMTLQSQLGASRLQSSDFTIITNDHEVTFNGVGKGHGVGLCLYTAERMAQRGESASEILNAFFPQTHMALLPNKKPEVKKTASQPRRRRSNRA